MSYHPPQFQETLASLKAQNDSRAPQFARAGARYRLAQSLKKIALEGMSAVLSLGYCQLLKHALTYSAHEMLTKSPEKSKPSMVSADLAARFRSPSLRASREAVTIHTTNEKLKKQLVALSDGSHTNVGVLSAAVRHLTLHGELSVYGSGLYIKTTQLFLEDLTSSLFARLDESFLEFHANLKSKAWT